MSKLAIFSDIHGNLPAFKVFLKDARDQGVTDYICLGDAANYGPQPAEALHALRKLNCPVVMGNSDSDLLNIDTLEQDNAATLDIKRWCAQQLYAEEKRFIRTFQAFFRLSFEELKLVAYHGSPRSYNDIIVGTTDDETLDGYFEGHEVDIYLGGHTHSQFIRRYYNRRVLNPGSVGLTFAVHKNGENYNPATVEYALLEVLAGEPNLTFRRVPYDVNLVVEAALESGMPHAEVWLEGFRKSQHPS